MSKGRYDTAAMQFYKVAKAAYGKSRKGSFSPISIIRSTGLTLLRTRRPPERSRRLSLRAP
jgi:hypothetical protein